MSRRPKKAQAYRCSECGSTEIEICLPAYFLANGTLEQPVSVDCQADALTYWCPDCGDNIAVRAPDGYLLTGVWDYGRAAGRVIADNLG